MKEPKRQKIIFERGYIKELFKSINQSALWFYQPYFTILGLDIAYFGIVFASFQIIAAFSSKYAHNLEEKIGEKYSLLMLIFLVGVSYFLMSSFIFLFSFSFCFIQQFVRGFQKIVVTDYINKLTKSNIRATILSVESLVGKLVYAFIIPIFGFLADFYSITQALAVIGITAFFIGLIFLVYIKNIK